jgi:hypothetical protein
MFVIGKVVSAQAVSSGAFNTRVFGGACGCSKLARGRRDAQGLEEGNMQAVSSSHAHGIGMCGKERHRTGR